MPAPYSAAHLRSRGTAPRGGSSPSGEIATSGGGCWALLCLAECLESRCGLPSGL